jgi:hypothetical protein
VARPWASGAAETDGQSKSLFGAYLISQACVTRTTPTHAPFSFLPHRSSYFLTGAFTGALIIMIPIIRFGVIDQDHHPSTVVSDFFLS